ncbi:hypothetical protein AUTU_41580 (plasmid) [Aureibacter tunicatorum]|nr:hypothetical protein AUTU_41580 [Aureibacter tunicatorum]
MHTLFALIKKATFVILLSFYATVSLAQENKSIFKYESDIAMDGRLDEPVWQKAEVLTDFHNFFPNDEGLADEKTEVRIFHDGKHLYIGAVYHDNSSEQKLSTLKRDVHFNTIVRSDAFGIVIDPFNKQNTGYYLALNSGNAQLDALIDVNGEGYGMNESWNNVWYSETYSDGNKKYFELKIPFSSINYDVNNQEWGFQFFVRDFKINKWMTYTDTPRNNLQFDLRYTETFKVHDIPTSNSSRLVLTPSVSYNHLNDLSESSKKSNITPSLDLQYNLTSSLKLDATINPDFSQVDVDQQVINVTRFPVNFPERRNFFLENSDLFNNLGAEGINPFYSRIIGSDADMTFGLKLSGNASPTTRIGVLNAQTEKNKETGFSQNYAVLVANQKLSKEFAFTGYMVSRQEVQKLQFGEDYNRVLGLNLNYISENNKWSGVANYGKSYNHDLSGDNDFINLEATYNTRETFISGAVSSIAENYITDVGFTPRLYNYDAVMDTTIRKGSVNTYFNLQKNAYPKKSKTLDRYRYLFYSNDAFWSHDGRLTEMTNKVGNTIWFKRNMSALYFYISHYYNDLPYHFDILNNDRPIAPGIYNNLELQLGYNNRMTNKNFYYGFLLYNGGYFNGTKVGVESEIGYRRLPLIHLNAKHIMNRIDLNELGSSTFHLFQFSGELFITNRLNWTTYAQYNTQIDNVNINSRIQWEYRPLSYVYLVVTDNYNEQMRRKNWGVALKINYRLTI